MAMGVLPMGASAVGAEEVSVDFSTTAQGDYLVSKSGYAVVTDTTYTPAAGCKDIYAYEDIWLAYNLGELAAGQYDGTISCIPQNGGSTYNFYIVPKSDDVTAIANAFADARPIAKADGYAEGVDWWTPVGAGTAAEFSASFTLENDGEYMLVMQYDSGDPVSGELYGIFLDEFDVAVL